MSSGLPESKDIPQSGRDWVVVLKQPTSGAYDDLVSKIVAVTGWPKELAEVEVDVGFPVTLAAGLTFSEAVDLKDRSVDCGLVAEVKSIS